MIFRIRYLRFVLLSAAAGVVPISIAQACPAGLIPAPGFPAGVTAFCVRPGLPFGLPLTGSQHIGQRFAPDPGQPVGDTVIGDTPVEGKRDLKSLIERPKGRRLWKSIVERQKSLRDAKKAEREAQQAFWQLEQDVKDLEKLQKAEQRASRDLHEGRVGAFSELGLPGFGEITRLRRELIARGYRVNFDVEGYIRATQIPDARTRKIEGLPEEPYDNLSESIKQAREKKDAAEAQLKDAQDKLNRLQGNAPAADKAAGDETKKLSAPPKQQDNSEKLPPNLEREQNYIREELLSSAGFTPPRSELDRIRAMRDGIYKRTLLGALARRLQKQIADAEKRKAELTQDHKDLQRLAKLEGVDLLDRDLSTALDIPADAVRLVRLITDLRRKLINKDYLVLPKTRLQETQTNLKAQIQAVENELKAAEADLKGTQTELNRLKPS